MIQDALGIAERKLDLLIRDLSMDEIDGLLNMTDEEIWEEIIKIAIEREKTKKGPTGRKG